MPSPSYFAAAILASASMAIAVPIAELHGGDKSLFINGICPLSKAEMSPSTLPPVSESSRLLHIALGRGSQNYTCGSDPATAPRAVGAVATLYNISCVTAQTPSIANALPALTVRLPRPLTAPPISLPPSSSTSSTSLSSSSSSSSDDDEDNLTLPRAAQNTGELGLATLITFLRILLPTFTGVKNKANNANNNNNNNNSNMPLPAAGPLFISGNHYFNAAGSPVFQLGIPGSGSHIICAKDAGVDAPSDAPRGPRAEPAVAWLKLKCTTANGGNRVAAAPTAHVAREAAASEVMVNDEAAAHVGGVVAVYRIQTAGGSAPQTCAGREGQTFPVEYAAQYWFYG